MRYTEIHKLKTICIKNCTATLICCFTNEGLRKGAHMTHLAGDIFNDKQSENFLRHLLGVLTLLLQKVNKQRWHLELKGH